MIRLFVPALATAQNSPSVLDQQTSTHVLLVAAV
jgi:hypothetical protein